MSLSISTERDSIGLHIWKDQGFVHWDWVCSAPTRGEAEIKAVSEGEKISWGEKTGARSRKRGGRFVGDPNPTKRLFATRKESQV